MRMLVKYTSFTDFDKDGNKRDESFYLSFVRGEEVMDIPFDTFEEMKKFTNPSKLNENIKTQEFLDKISYYDDYKDFFKDIDFIVLYDDTIKVDFKEMFNEE